MFKRILFIFYLKWINFSVKCANCLVKHSRAMCKKAGILLDNMEED